MKFKPTENFSASVQQVEQVWLLFILYLVYSVHIHALNKLRWDTRHLTEVNKNSQDQGYT